MPVLTVTSKGQVTLRRDVLRHLGVEPGEKIEVDLLPNGCIEVRAERQAGRIADFCGILKRPDGKVLTIEEIGDIAARGWAGKI